MDQLQLLILGERRDELTPAQLRNLIKVETTPKLVLYIAIALNRGLINPDLFLIQSISTARKEYDLVLIGMALRAGANPNVYVNQPQVGKMHILAYVYNELQGKVDEDFIINGIVIMLVASGSSPTRMIFDDAGGLIKISTLYSKVEGKTVLEYLEETNTGTILPQLNESLTNVEPAFLTRLSIYLDRKEFIHLNILELPENLRLAVKAHSNTVLTFMLNSSSYKTTRDPILKDVIDNINLSAWQTFLELGEFPDYGMVNYLLIRLQKAKMESDTISLIQYFEMVEVGVIRGLTLDLDQYEMLKFSDQQRAEIIKEKYEEPYWQKTCKVETSPASIELKRLAYSLNINPHLSKESICSSLRNIAKVDPSKLKEAALIRQKSRISIDMSNPNEFAALPVSSSTESVSFSRGGSSSSSGSSFLSKPQESGTNNKSAIPTVTQSESATLVGSSNTFSTQTIPNLVCRNKVVMNVDPYDQHDLDLAYYRDDSGAIWCFTSDQFLELEDKKKNPYTGQSLTEKFLDSLKEQRRLLVRLGVIAKGNGTFSESVDNFNKKDTISNNKTEEMVNSVIQAAAINGITEAQLKTLTPAQMSIISNRVYSEQDLIDLTPNHRYNTFLRSSYESIQDSSSETANFFDKIKTIIYPEFSSSSPDSPNSLYMEESLLSPLRLSPQQSPAQMIRGASPLSLSVQQSQTTTPMGLSLQQNPVQMGQGASPVRLSVQQSPVQTNQTAAPIELSLQQSPVQMFQGTSPVRLSVQQSPVQMFQTTSPARLSVQQSPMQSPLPYLVRDSDFELSPTPESNIPLDEGLFQQPGIIQPIAFYQERYKETYEK